MPQALNTYGSREIRLNDSGDDVREIQIKIVAFGDANHNVPCDGTFGDSSVRALKNFCKLFGIPVKEVVDVDIYTAIEKWVSDEADFLNIFKETFPCTCSRMGQSRKPRAFKIWNDEVKGKLPLASGETAGDPTCSGFGSGLTKAHKYPDYSIRNGRTVDFIEKPGFNKILLWATLGARKILKAKLNKSGLGMSINNGYRCQLKYFDILLQKVDDGKLETEPVGIGNHIGNAIDLNIAACNPSDSRRLLRGSFCFFETFDKTENRLRLEPLEKSPRWTHIDTFTFKYQPYVTSVEDALAPRYTAGQATSPAIPPKAAPQKAPQPAKAPAKQQPSKPATAPGSTPTLKDLLKQVDESKEWFQSHWNSFFDAYRESEIADAHDAIQSDRGYFPVGMNLTWHGGIHAQVQSDGLIHAMADGVIVAARLPEKDPTKLSYGSRNFVLLKHKTPKGKPFWSLYMHLRPLPLKAENPDLGALFPWLVKQTLRQIGTEPSNFRSTYSADAPVLRTIAPGETLSVLEQKLIGTQKWIKAKADKDNLEGWTALTSRYELMSEIDKLQDLQAGKVVKFNKPVKLNDCLGLVSPAKPGASPFVHWEVFSDQVVSDQWIQVKDDNNDIVCDAEEFKKLLNKSQAITFYDPLTKANILAAYQDAKISAAIRKRTFFFKSEWSVDWKPALQKLKDDFPVDDLAPRLQLYNFWKDAEAASCDLPKGGKVWHYHPVEFINREFPVPKAVAEEQPSTTVQNGNFTIIDQKALVREATPPHKSTKEIIPYFSRITVKSTSGDFSTVQVNGTGPDLWTSKRNYVSFIKDDPRFSGIQLAPSKPLSVNPTWTPSQKQTASTYNRLGGLLHSLSEALDIEIEAAIAVWRVESNGQSHTPNQAIIRFEAHHFWKFWGKNNVEKFDNAFKFGGHGSPGKTFEGHKISKDSGNSWNSFHGNQSAEYDALAFATSFDKESARKSISIGGCQIMISNHAICGYKTASSMYDAFQADERNHVLGFFDFCKFCNGWHSGNNTMFNYAKAKDWDAFAGIYNGANNKIEYGKRIKNAYEEAKLVIN